jgi:hypothetical protein
MVFDIALGIVLGVLILRSLPLLINFGVVAVILGTVVSLLAFVISLILSNDWIAMRALVIGIPIGVMVVGQMLVRLVSSRTIFSREEVGAALLVTSIVCGVMLGLFVLVQSAITTALGPVVRFVILPTLFFWCLGLLAALASKLHRIWQIRAIDATISN